ncbi:hypothetical protein Ciccas_010070 [Cichlidogyrus casuarinus]|uniref:BPTI/Kunitz inhibitor domain-containing protein n=1 Tax=Cichlidogyrus casuarinus TaxID=1844966 RepID=A0ABD2PVR2_9PLAT
MSSFAGFIIFLAAIWLAAGTPKNCLGPLKSDFCGPTEMKWGFVEKFGKCVEFVYGGCGGNHNRFDTRMDCENNCQEVIAENINYKNCNDPRDDSECLAAFQRYFFNRNTRKCELFIWGGCGANGNNFKSLLDCQLACEPVN